MLAGVFTPAAAQQDAANIGTKLMTDAAVKAAVEAIKAGEPQTIEDQIRLCEIEAPPFREQKRADVYARMFREAGLQTRSARCFSSLAQQERIWGLRA